MGVLPLQFKAGASAQSLKLDGSEIIDFIGIDNGITPMQDVTMAITRKDGKTQSVPLACGSIRRSRSITTCTAGSCPTFCAS